MAYIKKVVKGLECHYKDGCTRCPYDGIESDTTCGALLCNDALELLKEYKAIKETISDEIHETAKQFRRQEGR